MRHGRKGCGRTDEEKLRGASKRQHKRERRGVCIRPGLCLCLCVSVLRAMVACKKSLVAKEFSQHRHRHFSPCDCLPPDWTNGTKKSTAKTFRNDA